MDKLEKYGYSLNEQTSKAVKQVEKLLGSWQKDMAKMKKTYYNRFSVAVDGMTTVEEMNSIVNNLNFEDELAGELMSIMGDKAEKLGVIDDYEGEIQFVGTVKKWRRKKMRNHKHRKKLKATRAKRHKKK